MFIVATFDSKYKAFEIHITTLSFDSGDKMHLLEKVWIVYLKANKALLQKSLTNILIS